MKSRLSLIGLWLIGASSLAAGQTRLEITPLYGIRLGGSVDLEEGSTYDRLELRDGGAAGILIGYDLRNDGSLELQWTRQDSELVGARQGQANTPLVDLSIDQIRLNGLYLWQMDRLRPFLLFGMGATVFDPDSGYHSETRFSGALGGGVKIDLMKQGGLRLDARWTPTVISSDSAFLCSGGGSGLSCTAASSGNVMSQWEFTAGLMIRL